MKIDHPQELCLEIVHVDVEVLLLPQFRICLDSATLKIKVTQNSWINKLLLLSFSVSQLQLHASPWWQFLSQQPLSPIKPYSVQP